jgi:hypothetical protein
MTETPKFEGPLVNPGWTPEQNRRYDEAESRNTPQLAREEALLGAEVEIEPTLGDIAQKARGLVDQQGVSTSQGKPKKSVRPYRARYKDTTDYVTRQLRDV